MRRTAALAAFALVTTLAMGDGYNVTYLEGQVQVKSAAGWVVLSIGGAVPASASIRVGADGFAQIGGGGTEFLLTRPGTYVLKDLVAARDPLLAHSPR